MSEVELVFPFKTRAVSITGRGCALNCAHCNRHYLENMPSLEEVARTNGIKSVLVSGGCEENGEVPLLKFKKQILALKKKYRIIAHTGLVAPENVRELKGLVDVVSFDFPPSTRAIKEVFGIDKRIEDYAGSLAALARYVQTVPHVTIGLREGVIDGEMEALETLAGMGMKKIVMNVLVPTPGTRYENVKPPPVGEVVSLLREARDRFDFVYLGCMRPTGEYRKRLDGKALELGIVDRIVMPAKGIAREGAGVFYECCAL